MEAARWQLDKATVLRIFVDLDCTWHGPAQLLMIRGATLDSRKATPDCVFICCRGEHVDGHDYAESAVSNGAGCVIAEEPIDVPVPVLQVSDSTRALQLLATWVREQYWQPTWIGITGSNGKTTVKELVKSACSAAGSVYATLGNLNNHLGVPLTILNAPAARSHIIIEMGASAVGEIAELAAIAQPQIGIITGIGPAHLDGFGDLLGVATGKGELFAALPDGATALLGMHGMEAASAAQGVETESILGILKEAAQHAHLRTIPADPAGRVIADGVEAELPVGTCALPLFGAHNIANIHLAWQAAVAAGVDGAAACASMAAAEAVGGRLAITPLRSHKLFDDSYNANPASMNAGLEVLSREPGIRLAILGAMGELGSESQELHQQVGRTAARCGVAL